MDFSGKKAYIFGGSSGIGLCAAEKLVERGVDAAVFSRNREKLAEAEQRLTKAAGGDASRIRSASLDVSDRESIQAAMENILPDFGPPDILINSAGRAYPRRFEDITYEQFDQTMRINLYGAWNTIAYLLPHMKEQAEARIVNVSSVAGMVGVFGYTDYCASKFGLIGFSEALRGELRPRGIHVSVLCPPDTDTPAFEEENKTKPEETHAISGNVKLMSPEAVAEAMIKGMIRKRFLIVPGMNGRFSVLAKRLLPNAVYWFMDQTVSKVQRNRKAGA